MPRTTVNIDESVLRELRRRQRREGKSLGELMSELLAAAMDDASARDQQTERLGWTTAAMHARVDLEDKEALHRALEDR